MLSSVKSEISEFFQKSLCHLIAKSTLDYLNNSIIFTERRNNEKVF